MSRIYLQVILLFAPMFMMNNLLLCFVRNDGAPQRSMAAMIGGSLSNVVLDYVFMFPFGMGIFGAVFATGLAPVISMGILSPFFLQKKSRFRLRVKAYSMAGWLRQAGYILSSGPAVPDHGGFLRDCHHRIQRGDSPAAGKYRRGGLWCDRQPVPRG